jgi:nucleoside-diphosphate-sugar epimerase
MKIAVVGATGVIGASAIAALVPAGHDVFGLAPTPKQAELVEAWGATAVPADIFDHESLVTVFEGCDVIVNVPNRIPVGYRAMRPSAWREQDRLRTEGVCTVVAAARDAHVRRIVQDSVSLVYADHGDDWIDEQSALGINAATEPACVSESHLQEYQSDLRHGVVLRLGRIFGDDATTRFLLRGVRRGRSIGLGPAESWIHPLHTDDIGSAVVAALQVPGGVYNVGAEPVRRKTMMDGFAEAAGKDTGGFMGLALRRLNGRRAEPFTRSLRVSSEHFRLSTGWTPTRTEFDASWLEAAGARREVLR